MITSDFSKIKLLFKELLASAIWQRAADVRLFSKLTDTEWDDLFKYANIQRVTAMINDAVEKLPENCQPPNSLLIKLAVTTNAIEQANKKVNAMIARLTDIYKNLDIDFALLKGQGNGLYYPNPLHRTSGDIDAYLFGEGAYERAKQWVMEKGYPHEAENMHHLGYDFENIHIENHYHVAYFTNEKYNRPLQQKIKEIVDTENFELVKIGEVAVRVLPVEFNAFYVFEHFFHHFIHTGTGLRQVCDWALLLQARTADINKERFTALAQQFGLLQAMRVFAHAAVKHLGAKPEIFPFELGEDNRYSDLVMEDILNGGHFGLYRPDVKNVGSEWADRWYRYKSSIKRSFLFGAIAPSHIRILPLTKIFVRLKLALKGA